MSKILTFNDGTSVQVTDASTPTDIIMIFSSLEEASAMWERFTPENMKSAMLDGFHISVVPTGGNGSIDDNGNVTFHFTGRIKSESEILEDQITELQVAVAELADIIISKGGIE